MVNKNFELILGDCLEQMVLIGTRVEKVDLILADLPYGTTNCSWDSILPLQQLWECYRSVLKETGSIILTSTEPFTSKLIMSNLPMFKYDIVWNKKRPTGHLNKNVMPLRQHEQILVFGNGIVTYNPQMHKNKLPRDFRGANMKPQTENYGQQKNYVSELDPDFSYPRSIIEYTAVIGNSNSKVAHSTQKPIELMDYLVATFSNKGDLVLDNTMGSGTTGVACMKQGRMNLVKF